MPESRSKLNDASVILKNIKKYVGDNIKNNATLILDIWEVTTSSTTLSARILNLKEYIQNDLENDENFYKELGETFSAKI
jgi:hypothetical protein